MPADTKEILKRVLAEIDREEETEANEQARQELEALKGRKVTIADMREAISEADPETRAELRAILAEETAPKSREPLREAPKPKDDAKPKPKPAKPQTRPGRRAGGAYDWDVDEDGRVVRLDVVRVYNGPDEDETIEVPADDEEDAA